MKIRRISDFQSRISFPNFDSHYQTYLRAFQTTELGMIHKAIPWSDLAFSLGMKQSAKGPDCIFSPSGKLALMFLKNYSGCSDEKLMEQLNGNIYY